MKVVSDHESNNWERVNLQIISLAAGLLIGVGVITTSGGLNRGGQSTGSMSPAESRSVVAYPLLGTGVVMDEPDFGSVAADFRAFEPPAEFLP